MAAKKRKITEATRRARRKYNATPKAKKRRAELNKINRQKGTYGNGICIGFICGIWHIKV